jgi:hypothetical protein
MGGAWNGLWLAAAFASELAALAALGWWGFGLDGSLVLRGAVGIGLPLLAAVLWGVFAAPRAPVQVLALTLLVELVVFGGAVLALVATGHPRLAVALGVVALLSSVLSASPDAVTVSAPPG